MASEAPDYPIVLVLWRDAFSHYNSWTTLDDIVDDQEEAIVYSTGYMVGEDKPGGRAGHVTLWQTMSEGDAINQFCIPKDMVVNIVHLSGKESLTDPFGSL